MANWRSVITWGKYEELSGDVERIKAMTLLSSKIIPITSSETRTGARSFVGTTCGGERKKSHRLPDSFKRDDWKVREEVR